MSDDEVLALVEAHLDDETRNAWARDVQRRRWPGWSFRNVLTRVRAWINPEQPHHLPLVEYRRYLARVGVDPLAALHAEAVAEGQRWQAERRLRALEAERAELEAALGKPGVRGVRSLSSVTAPPMKRRTA